MEKEHNKCAEWAEWLFELKDEIKWENVVYLLAKIFFPTNPMAFYKDIGIISNLGAGHF